MHISWLSTTSGRPAVHVAPINGGHEQTLAPDALFGHPSNCYCWEIDNESIWLLSVPDDNRERTSLLNVTLANEIVSEIPLNKWSWLHGTTDDGIVISDWDRTKADSGDLYLVESESGEQERLTFYEARIESVAVNQDGHLAYTIHSQSDKVGSQSGHETVIRYANGTTSVLEDVVRPITWNRDRLLLEGSGDEENVGIRQEDGEIDWIGTGQPIGFLGTEQVLVIADGCPTVLPEGDTLDSDLDSVAGGSAKMESAALKTASTDEAPSRILGWRDGETTTVTAPEYAVSPGELPGPDAVTYTDSTDEDREAWLLLPETTPAPCVVHLYGAFPERGRFNRKFYRPLHHLREEGYAIFVPAHGGERFSTRRHSDYSAAAEWIRKQEWSNEQVVAVGHSSGGYDVLMQATRFPEQWTGGVSWNGIADLREFYEIMEKSQTRIENQLGDDTLNRLNSLSPALDSNTVEFPLLCIQGEHDWMTPQIRNFVAEAEKEGACIELEEIEGMAHWTRDRNIQIRIWGRIKQFLQNTL
jgi:dipeptidyl aminopeptidase/acylaminoacyl peptidase